MLDFFLAGGGVLVVKTGRARIRARLTGDRRRSAPALVEDAPLLVAAEPLLAAAAPLNVFTPPPARREEQQGEKNEPQT